MTDRVRDDETAPGVDHATHGKQVVHIGLATQLG